jgi:alpha-mannosidase
MTDRPVVHLICTAHIDPVWMWSWEEGLREAISTFHTAAQLLDEFPEFVFNHNESLLYEWIEEYDPPLFERIRRLVRARRWNITGGWYLQPDCNLPGGETLVRVILEGRRYFQEKFGVRPPVAYNFDTFGHPGSLPQLLNQSGFEFYIHCRPVESQMEIPAALYRWRGVDGSEVMTLRPDTGWYGTPNPGQAMEQAHNGIRLARETGRDTLVTWGLGDHGGGATRDDLLAFRALLQEFQDADIEVRHSTPEAYLTRMRAFFDELPVREGELQRTLSGTYTSVAVIKRQQRAVEALLTSAERWSAIAWWRTGVPYPSAALKAAWKRVMFNTFHDILCGSLLEGAIPGVMSTYGYAEETARRLIVKAQHALLPDVSPQPETIPLYVFNPHAAALRGPVGINFLAAYAPPPAKKPFSLYDDRGKPVACQTTGGESVILNEGTWQPFCGFIADMPPLAVRRYEIRFEEPAQPPVPSIAVNETEDGISIKTPYWQATFSREQAALRHLVEQSGQRQLLRGPVQLFAMRDEAHAWGGESNWVYNQPVSPLNALSPAAVGDFTGMEGHEGPALRVIAEGPAWVTVECLVGWQHTRASIRYTFYAELPFVDIDTRLYMQARRKMIKLQLPFDLPAREILAETPYGVAIYPADATEYPYARWACLEAPDMIIGVANSGQNGLDVNSSGTLNLSISRGATHCSWSEEDVPLDKSYTFMDQTQIDTAFRLVAGSQRSDVIEQLHLAALELNQPLERFFTYTPATRPENSPPVSGSFVTIEPATITLGALKKAEDRDALVLRFQEIAGQATRATIQLEGFPAQQLDFAPYEIRSFVIEQDGSWHPVNLLEEPAPRGT